MKTIPAEINEKYEHMKMAKKRGACLYLVDVLLQ